MNQGDAPTPLDARQLLLQRLHQRRPAAAPTQQPPAGGTQQPPAGGGRAADRAADRAELSFAQQRLWFLDQWSPGNLAYVIPVLVRLRGRLDPDALDAALHAVIDRHAALRTSFPARDGRPIQLVHPAVAVRIERVDLTELPEREREPQATARAREIARVPFDLATGPVLRAATFRLRADEHLMLLAVHHIVSDGWSTNLLLDDLAAAYTAARQTGSAALPPVPVRYLDYAREQRRELTDAVLAQRCARWADLLRGAPTILDLPLDRPRPPVQTFTGAVHRFRVPADVTGRLRRQCQAGDATLFMGLLAAFGAVLRRYSGADDLLVGTPVANRIAPEHEQVVGLFVNTVALRVDATGDPSFAELLARVRRAAIAGYAMQDTPFDRLVDHLRLDRDPARSPLTQVLFAMQYRSDGPRHLDAVELTPADLDTGTTTSDLVLNLREDGDGLAGLVEYNADLFDPDTIERIFTNFGTLLASAVDTPEAPLSRLRLLSAAEEHLVLRGWNRTAVAWPEATIPELFAAQVAATPDAVAVVCGDTTLTYRELDRRADRLARHLAGLGVRPESLVGVFLERSDHLMVSLLAILKAGGAYVPLDPDYPADRLAFMIEDSGAALVLTSGDLLTAAPETQVPLLPVDALPGAGAGVAPAGETAGADGVDAADVDPRSRALPVATPDDLAYMIYTSGSTGRPKGVQIPHRGVVNHLRWLQDTFQLTGDDRLVQKTSICFDVSVFELFWPLTVGATLVLAKPDGHRDPAYLGELIRAQRVTVAYFVPSTLRLFLDLVDVAGCADLRLVFCGGEALPVELANRLLAAAPVRLANIYGPTEASIDATWWDCRPGWTRSSVPIGRPVANTQVYVLDAAMRPLPIGVPGELFIGGVQLARGYGNRPELTAERFITDPFTTDPTARLYRTGDLVRWLGDGSLEFLGRNDDQIKLRGLRIELGEIETCLATHPAVGACAVTVYEPTPGDQRLVGYVLPAPGAAEPSAQQLRAHLADALPEYMIPTTFVVLAELPLTANGKTDRKALPRPKAAKPGAGPQASDPLERAIAAIWQDVLGLPAVSVTDSFFELGGHSLLLVTVHQRLAAVLPAPVALVDLFRYPTVQALARYCQQRETVGVAGRRRAGERGHR